MVSKAVKVPIYISAYDDFGLDDIFIDRAYVELKAPSEYVPLDGKLKLLFGKQKNIFRWKNGKDYLLWDGDVNPEGVGIQYSASPYEGTSFYLNTGYYIADENSTSKDPHVFGIQGGASHAASEAVEVGGRVSWYNWRSVNNGFLARSASTGNVPGLADSEGISTLELAGYLRYTGVEDWPVLVFGHFAKNMSTGQSSTPV